MTELRTFRDPESLRAVLDAVSDGVYVTDPERRILLWNRAAETITGYAAEEVLGHSCAEDILKHTDEEGRRLCREGCPLAATIKDGLPRQADVWLLRQDGARLPVRVRALPLRSPTGEILGAVETFSSRAQEMAALKRIEELEAEAYLDALTHLPNRRFLMQALEARSDEHRRYGWPFSVVLLDIDHFKQINDTFGHDTGDRVLSMVASTLAVAVRSFDVVGRWGGEEFLAVLAHSDAEHALGIAERMRRAVEQSELRTVSGHVRVTVSAGTTAARRGEEATLLLRRADRLLYESKAQGRNRVTAG